MITHSLLDGLVVVEERLRSTMGHDVTPAGTPLQV